MRETGLFLFPWDLRDEGLEHVLSFAAVSGIRTLYLASCYHAGLFLQPHNPVNKVYLLEDGVVYFHPQFERYGTLRPKIAEVSRDTDWFSAVAEKLPEFGLKLAAWTVCMHNSRIGEQHPAMVVRDAFFNLRSFALCPSHPEVRRYVRTLIQDMARYRLSGNLLEAFRYMDVVHGLHHERWSIPLPPLERWLLSLSFAPTDLEAAAAAGIDGERVRRTVRLHLERFLVSYPDLPAARPRTIEEFETRHPEVGEYRRCLSAVLDSLLSEITAALKGHDTELIGQGRQEFNITCNPGHNSLQALVRAVYDLKPAEARASVLAAKESVRPGQKIYAVIRLGFDAVGSAGELAEIVAGVSDAGADGVLFYNYAECAGSILRWIAPALKRL